MGSPHPAPNWSERLFVQKFQLHKKSPHWTLICAKLGKRLKSATSSIVRTPFDRSSQEGCRRAGGRHLIRVSARYLRATSLVPCRMSMRVLAPVKDEPLRRRWRAVLVGALRAPRVLVSAAGTYRKIGSAEGRTKEWWRKRAWEDCATSPCSLRRPARLVHFPFPLQYAARIGV